MWIFNVNNIFGKDQFSVWSTINITYLHNQWRLDNRGKSMWGWLAMAYYPL